MYACESWTLTAELEKRTQAFEMRCYRRLLNISYKDHVTNEEVRRKIQAAIGEYDELLTLVKKRKLRWFGHVSRSSRSSGHHFTNLLIAVDDKMAAKLFSSQNKTSSGECDSLTPCSVHLPLCSMQKILQGYSSAK